MSASEVLVVDLDGALVKTSLLQEAINAFVTQNPLSIPRFLAWLVGGRAVLKVELAKAVDIDPSSLPYRTEVVDWLGKQRHQGRRLVLVTDSHTKWAEAVARHLELFDEVLLTESGTMRAKLVERFGELGFDYVGSHKADLPTWKAAKHAHVANHSPSLLTEVKNQGQLGKSFADKTSLTKNLLKAARPHQWVKNLLLLIPLMSAHAYGDFHNLVLILYAFIAFSMTASSVYLLNDLVDIWDDRRHARKCKRPLASGNLSLAHGWMTWPVLLLSAFTMATLTLPTAFLAVLATYYALTLAYSLTLKNKPILDVLTLAGLYTLRMIAGAAAVQVLPSFWLLAFSMSIFLSLAFIKRFSELRALRGKDDKQKLLGRDYLLGDLEMISSMGIAAGYLSVLIMALYVQDPHTADMYQTPEVLWLTCPVLLYWISRAWLITHRGKMHDDPVVFAIKDRRSWVVAVLFICIFMLAGIL